MNHLELAARDLRAVSLFPDESALRPGSGLMRQLAYLWYEATAEGYTLTGSSGGALLSVYRRDTERPPGSCMIQVGPALQCVKGLPKKGGCLSVTLEWNGDAGAIFYGNSRVGFAIPSDIAPLPWRRLVPQKPAPAGYFAVIPSTLQLFANASHALGENGTRALSLQFTDANIAVVQLSDPDALGLLTNCTDRKGRPLLPDWFTNQGV